MRRMLLFVLLTLATAVTAQAAPDPTAPEIVAEWRFDSPRALVSLTPRKWEAVARYLSAAGA